MKASILYIFDSSSDFEDTDEMESFFKEENYNYNVIKSHPDIKEEQFEVTDQIEEDNFGAICYGRVASELFTLIDLRDEYWTYWCYIKNQNGQWDLAEKHFKKDA